MKSKWLTGLLVVSLTFNLLLIGFGIGRLSGEQIRAPRVDPTMGFTRMIEQFPGERREELLPLAREHHRSMRPLVRSIRQGHQAVHRAVTDEPLDAERLRERLTELRRALNLSQTANHEAFVQFASALTPEERRLWQEWLQQRTRRHDRRGPPHRQRP